MGTNAAGHTFVATRLLTVPRPVPVERGVQRRVKEAFNVMTAAGPFCCADDLAYAPLVALLKEAKTRKAALLVLHGPLNPNLTPTPSPSLSPNPNPNLALILTLTYP